MAGCSPAMVTTGPWPDNGAPPGMSAEAWTHALAAHERAASLGLTNTTRLAVIDYSLPSTDRRLWVVDLATGEVYANEYVAHAMNSGGTWATSFSNRDGSKQSSLGTFVTAGTYSGVRGLSLRLKGLEPGINDRAWQRGIVMHGTYGVSDARARRGSLGRTEGCPAVSFDVIRRLVGLLQGGVVIFAWAPDRGFLAHSDYLDRGAAAIRLSSGS
jgi:hypothetical protein